MDKQEIKNRLIAARELQTANRGSKNWKDAFKAYEQATGIKLDIGCNKCFQRVLDWLNES
jgi:hypothetical protein